jgi:hypothetical protein
VHDQGVLGLSIRAASSKSRVVWEYSPKWEVNSF